MKRSVELILLLPLILFLAYALVLYITSGGERWNPITLPAPAVTDSSSSSAGAITPVSPPVAASIFSLPLPSVTATQTPQPLPTATRTPSPTRSPSSVPTSSPTQTITPTLTSTPSAGASVPVGLRVHCQNLPASRFDWLVILSSCEMVTGDVVLAYLDSPPAGDGDYIFNVRLDAGQEAFLSPGNEALGETLHAEILVDDQRQMIDLPKAGMHIVLIGAWVQNSARDDWNEFNPAWYWAELP